MFTSYTLVWTVFLTHGIKIATVLQIYINYVKCLSLHNLLVIVYNVQNLELLAFSKDGTFWSWRKLRLCVIREQRQWGKKEETVSTKGLGHGV